MTDKEKGKTDEKSVKELQDAVKDLAFDHIDIFLACRQLKNMDLVGATDAQIKVFSEVMGREIPYGETEVVNDSLNPNFTTTIRFEYHFEKKQPIRFEVIDMDGKKKSEVVGSVHTTLGEIVACETGVLIKDLMNKGKSCGKLVVRSEVISESQEVADVRFFGENLYKEKASCFKWNVKPKANFKIARPVGESGNTYVYDSEVFKKANVNPEWEPFKISLQKLCNADYNRPIYVEVYNAKKKKNNNIGIGQFTIDEIVNNGKKQITLKRENQGETAYGKITVEKFQIDNKATFLDYIRGGLQLNVMVAIDFTSSNGDPRKEDSLHAVFKDSDRKNPYQKAIKAICDILLCYDYDQKTPIYGFGGKPQGSSEVSHCFPMVKENERSEAQGVDQILDTYLKTLRKTTLSGPSNLATILAKAKELAKKNKETGSKEYMIALILTDGVINDMEDSVNEIIDSTGYPLSIIIIGIGTANFDKMNRLDGDQGLENSKGQKASRDICQFVPFSKFENDEIKLAEQVLEEVPQQVLDYMKAEKINPGPQKEKIDIDKLLGLKREGSFHDDKVKKKHSDSADESINSEGGGTAVNIK